MQIHPSLRCNLRCAHCYSSSGPLARTELESGIVRQVISDAAALGFQVLAVSGGEPLAYAELESVLAHAKCLGLRTTMTTNGSLNDPRRLDWLRDVLDLLAVSLDGPPDLHDAIRGAPGAFEQVERGIAHVRAAGIAFGFIHTLTRRSLPHLPWLAEVAAKHEARLLQIHPLERAGRAATDLPDETLDEAELARAYVLCAALAVRHADAFRLQLDVLHRDQLRDEPDLVYAGRSSEALHDSGPGLLVLEPDGTVVPVAYGFSRRYAVCNVRERRLAAAWDEYLDCGHRAFRELCRSVWEELSGPDMPLLCNWHERVAARSHAP